MIATCDKIFRLRSPSKPSPDLPRCWFHGPIHNDAEATLYFIARSSPAAAPPPATTGCRSWIESTSSSPVHTETSSSFAPDSFSCAWHALVQQNGHRRVFRPTHPQVSHRTRRSRSPNPPQVTCLWPSTTVSVFSASTLSSMQSMSRSARGHRQLQQAITRAIPMQRRSNFVLPDPLCLGTAVGTRVAR